ncbi:MAG: hypothetical protein RL291_698 [Pseudomonadota bacterium]|jgi:hypothetical protein
MRRPLTAIAALVLLANSASSPIAAPLSPEACGKLAGEIKFLVDGGVRNLIPSSNPEAAAANLSPQDRLRIKRLLDAEAQLKFRCPQDQPLIVLRQETTEETQDQVLPGEEDGTNPAPAKKAPAKQSAPKTAQEPGSGQQPAKAQPKAPQGQTARPKVDDALRPTPPTARDPAVPPVFPKTPQ